ncbi:hypothetical protein BGZ76_004881 [Entomortierella beljakovae]|nr:hypothetical protein BGZ76_004881 [Entomortierella beljakovae]
MRLKRLITMEPKNLTAVLGENEAEELDDNESDELGDNETGELGNNEIEELEELIEKITSVNHKECNEWVINDACIACLVEDYRKLSIEALRRRELRKPEPADLMVLIGTFAPWGPTDNMRKVFKGQLLKRIRESFRKLELVPMDHSLVQQAILHKHNNDLTEAMESLNHIQDTKLRNLFQQFIGELPEKSVCPISEATLTVNNIVPILRSFVQDPSNEIFAQFPNTESVTQKKQGLKADRSDFKVVIAGKESSFGEFTGPAQKNHKSKRVGSLPSI